MSYLTESAGKMLDSTTPASDCIPVSSGVAFPLCNALLVDTAGTATLIMESGSTRTDVLLQKGYNPLRCTSVTFGTADDIWALY